MSSGREGKILLLKAEKSERGSQVVWAIGPRVFRRKKELAHGAGVTAGRKMTENRRERRKKVRIVEAIWRSPLVGNPPNCANLRKRTGGEKINLRKKGGVGERIITWRRGGKVRQGHVPVGDRMGKIKGK